MPVSTLLTLLALAIGGVLLTVLAVSRLRSHRLSQRNLALGYERRVDTPLVRKVELTEFDLNILKYTPESIKEQVSLKLKYSGKQGQSFLVAQLKAKYALLIFGLAAALLVSALNPPATIFSFLIAFVFFYLPDLRLNQEATTKRQKIGNQLPDALDQLTLLVDSGLDFQTAFVRVCNNSSGPLHEEFQRTLADLQLGITRKDAFEALGERTGSPVLKNFARAMVLADLFGVPITSVLSSQAIELRNARRARAEEEAQKIPTKITFPLVACLLPVILILLVGPSILSLIEVFGK